MRITEIKKRVFFISYIIIGLLNYKGEKISKVGDFWNSQKVLYNVTVFGFDIKKISFYTVRMFVAVICDIADAGHKDLVVDYLKRYGFNEVVENAFETTSISEKALIRLKRDIDKSTDFYDKIRFYQYPLEDTMVISFLKEKKWKKSVIRI